MCINPLWHFIGVMMKLKPTCHTGQSVSNLCPKKVGRHHRPSLAPSVQNISNILYSHILCVSNRTKTIVMKWKHIVQSTGFGDKSSTCHHSTDNCAGTRSGQRYCTVDLSNSLYAEYALCVSWIMYSISLVTFFPATFKGRTIMITVRRFGIYEYILVNYHISCVIN